MKNYRLFLTAAFFLLSVTFVDAHAFLDHSDPKVGSKVQVAPKEVKVWFTQKLVIAFSNLQVFDAAGTEVDKQDKHLDKTDEALLIVSLPVLKPGKYKVVWRAVSVDTHVTHGEFAFEVSP